MTSLFHLYCVFSILTNAALFLWAFRSKRKRDRTLRERENMRRHLNAVLAPTSPESDLEQLRRWV